MLGGVRVHRHPAHGVLAFVRILLRVVHMCVTFMNCHGDPFLLKSPGGIY